jgi:putative endonuclease
MAKNNVTGRMGEFAACAYMEACGYTIRHTNWHFRHYELDIVASDGNELVVVEVKTRSINYLLSPEQSINNSKIRRIVAAADAYVRKYDLNLPVRFDVICLLKNKQSCTVENHIEDAFYPPLQPTPIK